MAFLGEDGGADGGFCVGVEVVVYEAEHEGGLFVYMSSMFDGEV